jgi:Cation efflux family
MVGPRHHGHGHGITRPRDADGRWLAAAGALIVAFMCGEVVAGVIAHSLALLSDAAHMLTDAAAIGLALATMRLAARPPRGGYTYAACGARRSCPPRPTASRWYCWRSGWATRRSAGCWPRSRWPAG